MLIRVRLFFKYLFRFRAPQIININYLDYLIINKSYFLLSWKTKYAYKLRIKPFYSTFYNYGGSIYIAVPNNIDTLEVKISNLWSSRKLQVHLKKTEISVPFEFTLVPDFKQWQSTNISLPKLKTTARKLLVNNTQTTISKSIISVRNLTFFKTQA